MTKKQALNYLKSSGFSKEQIEAVVKALGLLAITLMSISFLGRQTDGNVD